MWLQWQAHLCGMCLSLRDNSGQLSRALTNTDAVMLSVLVEAQQVTPALRTTAGPCPLRGMRAAQVVPSTAVSARLGATASLTLAAAKAGDVVAERQHGLAGSAMKARAADMIAGPLRRAALADTALAGPVGTLAVLDDLAHQGELESAARRGDSVLTITQPTALSTGRIFASAATLAVARRTNTRCATSAKPSAHSPICSMPSRISRRIGSRGRSTRSPPPARRWRRCAVSARTSSGGSVTASNTSSCPTADWPGCCWSTGPTPRCIVSSPLRR